MNGYLNYSVTKESDAVEKYFCEKFSEAKFLPMSKDQTEILFKILLTKWSEEQQADIEKTLLIKSSTYFVLHKRIEKMFNITMDVKSKVFLSTIINSVGTAVMYGTYTAYKMKILKIKHLTINILCESIFPWGFLDDDTLDVLWKNQKVWRANQKEFGSDNLLDYNTAIQSLIQ